MAVIQGSTSGYLAEVDANNRFKVNLATAATPAQVGGAINYSENDAGDITGTPLLRSPETDDDYRIRFAAETIFDCETINYTTQNTGKHKYITTTMTNAWTATGLVTNSGNITTTTTGTSFSTWAEFPILGASILYCETEGSFNTQPTASTLVDFGVFRPGGTVPFAPTDGVSFRLTSAGMFGVINSNGTETQVGPFTWTYANNQKYQFIIAMHERGVEFWIDGVLYATIDTPAGQGQPCMSGSQPYSLRHAIAGGAAGAALSFTLNDYTISLGGPNIAQTASILGQRVYGSYQTLSGFAATHTSLATYPNSTTPTAAAPSNTALTANLPSGLGGQGIANATAAAATDLIYGAYLVPAGTTNIQGRRLVLRGVMVDAINTGAAVATTATTIQWSLAFGSSALTLAGTESATVKVARRVALGYMTWPVGAAIGQGPQGGRISMDFGDAPVFVNPGEYVMLVAKVIVGTATASQTISFVWQPTYGWE